ncbi:hypothetical protein Tco_1541755 [Tanacetum coccineum]
MLNSAVKCIQVTPNVTWREILWVYEQQLAEQDLQEQDVVWVQLQPRLISSFCLSSDSASPQTQTPDSGGGRVRSGVAPDMGVSILGHPLFINFHILLLLSHFRIFSDLPPLPPSLVITEYLVNISKRRAFWSLNEDILKITILTTNTPYPSRKIRRIRACTHQRPQRKQVQYVVSSEDQYAVLEI